MFGYFDAELECMYVKKKKKKDLSEIKTRLADRWTHS